MEVNDFFSTCIPYYAATNKQATAKLEHLIPDYYLLYSIYFQGNCPNTCLPSKLSRQATIKAKRIYGIKFNNKMKAIVYTKYGPPVNKDPKMPLV